MMGSGVSKAFFFKRVDFAFKSTYALYALTFILGIIMRGIPELLSGKYPVGYDTITYGANIINLNERSLSEIVPGGPLFYALMIPLCHLKPYDVFLALKVVGPVLYGFLSLSFYYFLSKGLGWNAKEGVLCTVLCTVQIVTLRISWDLFRNELGLIFLFPLLAFLMRNSANEKLLTTLAILVALSHPFVSILMFFIIIAVSFVKRKSTDTRHLLLPFLPSFLIFILVGIAYLIPLTTPARVLYVQAPPFFVKYSPAIIALYAIALILFCYGHLLPFILMGLRKDLVVSCMVVALCIGTLYSLTFALSWTSLSWRRSIILLIFPFMVYAMTGFKKLRLHDKHIKVFALLILVFSSVGVAYSSGTLPIRKVLSFVTEDKVRSSVSTEPPLANNQDLYFVAQIVSTYIPESIVQSSIPIEDADDLVASLHWINDNAPENSCLLAEERFYSWALIFLRKDITIIKYPQYYPPDSALPIVQEKRFKTVYLVWRGNLVLKGLVRMVAQGNISVFKLEVSDYV